MISNAQFDYQVPSGSTVGQYVVSVIQSRIPEFEPQSLDQTMVFHGPIFSFAQLFVRLFG